MEKLLVTMITDDFWDLTMEKLLVTITIRWYFYRRLGMFYYPNQ